MDSPQTILRDRIIKILGPTGNNTLAYIRYYSGTGSDLDLACWIGDLKKTSGTHGIAVNIDGLARYQVGRYSPSQRRNVASCGLVMDLWLPEDLNATEYTADIEKLNDEGLTIPIVSESMDISGQLLLNAIKDLPMVQSVRMMPPMQRGIYNEKPTLERMRCEVLFSPEMCIEELIA